MLHTLLDPMTIVKFAGFVGIVAIIFAESGLFFGFFFPGDSLLFTAGFLASQGLLSVPFVPDSLAIWALFIGVFIAAALGDTVGYAFGYRTGDKIFQKEDSFLFNKKYPIRAQRFYEKYGKKTIILGRFMPVVRTFAPIIAGVGHMNYRAFLTYNLVGGALWTLVLVGAGFVLGNTVPNAQHYISLIVLVIIVVSVVPPAAHFIQEHRRETRREKNTKI